jgi:peptide/nickel transport system substrate-binding protein
MKKRLTGYLWGFIVIFLALVLVACTPGATDAPTSAPDVSPPDATDAPPPTEVVDEGPVTLRVGLLNEPDCLHPFACSEHYFFVQLVYDTFNDIGPGCELTPRSAKSMEVSEDGLTWTIRLQEGMTFSDGEPYDAHALVDYYDWLASVQVSEWYMLTLFADHWEAVDDLTFQITTVEPVSTLPFYESLWVWPLPAHIWGDITDQTIWGFANDPPIGSGPYVLTDWVPGEYLIYDAREDYWAGKPPIDRIVMQVYANWDAIVQALIAGEVDVTDYAVPAQFYDTLEGASDVTVVEKPPGYRYYLAFNMYEGGFKHPAIEDPIVRKAIDLAIDKQQVIDIALLGHGIQCPTDWACSPALEDQLDPTLTVTPFDIAEANRILEEAGYVDTDGDGVRETPDGLPLDLRLFFDVDNPSMDTIAQMMAGWLPQIGINPLLEGFETSTLWDTVLEVRDFDLALRFFLDEFDPSGAFDFYLSCWSADAGSGALNESGYCNPEIDDLNYGIITTIDPEARRELSFAASHILNEDRPLVFIAGENLLQAYRSDRFSFPHDFCSIGYDLWGADSLMKAEIIK